MKCHCARSASLAMMLAVASTAWCQDTSLPSLFPLPPLPPVASGYPVSRAAATDALWGQEQISPVQTSPSQSPAQLSPMQGPTQSPLQKDLISPDYSDAMKGGYESCSTCYGGGCNRGCGYYVYANALLMSAVKQGGQVLAVDDVTGAQRLNYCNQEFGNIWRGGFEVGTGWCFNNSCGCCGCCPNALEFVYWGLMPATTTITALDNTNSTINFGDLNYNGQNANNAFTADELQRVQESFAFNSVEVNLLGNCNSCGPFGCGMCGCCCGSCGGRWGWGYTAGFRYINFFDRMTYTGDPTFDLANPAALNYLVATTNNLFGFQLGGGLQYFITDRFRAFVIGKAGIYDNSVTALQRVYGTLGNATINTGPNAGQDFVVRTAGRGTLATSGQIDIGGRWNVSNHWSIQGGYRVLGLAGVATTDVNIHNQNFHDVAGIASVNRFGSFIIHGFFAGATYCF